QQQLAIMQKCDLRWQALPAITNWDKVKVTGQLAHLIIDGLYGSGFHGQLSGDGLKVAQLINALAKPVLAIDVPSGLEADTGKASEDAVRAMTTVTLAGAKPGLYLYPGLELTGDVLVADIGIPQSLVAKVRAEYNLLDGKLAAGLLPLRPRNAHKALAGKVTLVAGSSGLTGAAALCSTAAVKAGAGLVTLLTPFSCQSLLATKLTEVMVQSLNERTPGVLGASAVSGILRWAQASDAVAMGPGLGTSEATQDVLLDVLPKLEQPVVLDADALNALVGRTEVLNAMTAPKILTPHPGEMARLIDSDAANVDANRLATAKHYAVRWNAVVVLKGAPTVIATPEGNVYINTTGNEGMATGGCGDVLTGVLTALLAQGLAPLEAALLGVYLHGAAADLVAQTGRIGLTASEIAQALPQARAHLEAEWLA
ncbi:MAG: NAD(P)H-hydrate dehydratase, partial [Acidaminococcaceae bacterium]